MGLETRPLAELVEGAGSGRLDIPEFQRGFVWRPEQVRALVDSLFRNYPVGLILAWDSPTYFSPRQPSEGPPTKTWLVDGQQRITASCLVFGRRPGWWSDLASWNQKLEETNVLANVTSDGVRLEFGLANPVRQLDPRWVSVREILAQTSPGNPSDPGPTFGPEASTIFAKISTRVSVRPAVAEIQARLRSLWEIRNRGIPVATVNHGLDDVTEIFIRLNQQGTSVLESDVSLAAASALHPGWVREEFLPFLRNITDSGFELDPGVVIRVLTALALGKTRLDDVPRDFWASSEFDETWTATKEALSSTFGLLMERGILSSDVLPSRNSLIPLALLRARFQSRGFHFPRALHWFLLANRDGRYTGASAAALAQDVRVIRDSANFSEALESLRGTLTVDLKISPAEFARRYIWNRPLLLILYLTMIDRKAVDWVTGRPLGRGRADGTLEIGALPYWHHFFPPSKGVLRSVQFDYTEDEVGALANVVILNQKPSNRSWSTAPPSKYVPGAQLAEAALEQQLVPPDRSLWLPDRYRDFLTVRSKALANATNRFLASLFGSPAT